MMNGSSTRSIRETETRLRGLSYPIRCLTNLRSFRDHGGKLIQYHGWSDAIIPPGGSVAYYEKRRGLYEQVPRPAT